MVRRQGQVRCGGRELRVIGGGSTTSGRRSFSGGLFFFLRCGENDAAMKRSPLGMRLANSERGKTRAAFPLPMNRVPSRDRRGRDEEKKVFDLEAGRGSRASVLECGAAAPLCEACERQRSFAGKEASARAKRRSTGALQDAGALRGCAGTSPDFAEKQAAILPLPKGEGRGEGEGRERTATRLKTIGAGSKDPTTRATRSFSNCKDSVGAAASFLKMP